MAQQQSHCGAHTARLDQVVALRDQHQPTPMSHHSEPRAASAPPDEALQLAHGAAAVTLRTTIPILLFFIVRKPLAWISTTKPCTSYLAVYCAEP